MLPSGGSKIKGFIVLAVLLFFVASNPSGAASATRMAGAAFVKVVDGFGVMFSDLGGDR